MDSIAVRENARFPWALTGGAVALAVLLLGASRFGEPLITPESLVTLKPGAAWCKSPNLGDCAMAPTGQSFRVLRSNIGRTEIADSRAPSERGMWVSNSVIASEQAPIQP